MLKSVNIYQSYGQKNRGPFFDSQCICYVVITQTNIVHYTLLIHILYYSKYNGITWTSAKPWLQLRICDSTTIYYYDPTTIRLRRISTYSLYHNCDSITIRRYHDALDYDGSIEITICVRFDCNTTTIRLRRIARLLPFNASKKWTCQFFVEVVVVSQSNRT